MATATGVKRQSVLDGTLQIYRTPDPIVQSDHILDNARFAAFQDCDVRTRRRRDTAETETTTPIPDMVAPLSAVGARAGHGAAS